ncbi:MAG: hypothetical protein ACI93R_000967 [Flavobacteriales bacterium]|jgi:hypothetical protein
MDVVVKLLIAHVVADFLLQWPAMLKSKAYYKFASPYLYLHAAIHLILSFVLVRDIDLWPVLLLIGITHGVIDGLKLTFTNESNECCLFFIDQLLHVVIIFIAVALWAEFPLLSIEQHPYFYPHVLFLIFITFPSSIIIQKFFLRWTLPAPVHESLGGAGVYIGYIERLLIYLAVVTQHWGLVGFLLAAKSLFRLGEVKKVEDRKYAEYILLGTLLSMTIALASGMSFLLVTGQSL